MVERPPAGVRGAAQLLVAPANELQVVLGRMVAEPVDVLVAFDAGLAHGRPDFHDPGKNAEVLERPQERRADDRLRVVAKIVMDGNGRIAGQLGALLPDGLVNPQVFGRHRVVGLVVEGTQQHAAPRMEGGAAGDVRVARDEVDDGTDFRLRRGIRAGAHLLEFLAPGPGKITIQIKPLRAFLDAQREAVVTVDAALGQQPVVGPAGLHGIAADQQPGLLRVRFPQSVGIGDAHLQDAAVAVHVLDGQPFDVFFVVGVRPRAGPDPFRLVGQRPLGAVRIDARAYVERARVEHARHVGVLAVLRDQRVQEVEIGCRGGHLGRVDVAVHPECRLLGGRSRLAVGDRHHPDVAALVAFPDRLERHEVRIFADERVQQFGEFGVAVEAVEFIAELANLRHLGKPIGSSGEQVYRAAVAKGGMSWADNGDGAHCGEGNRERGAPKRMAQRRLTAVASRPEAPRGQVGQCACGIFFPSPDPGSPHARIRREKSAAPSAAWARALTWDRSCNSGNDRPIVSNRPCSYRYSGT